MNKSVSLKKVSISFNEKLVLDEVSFRCSVPERVCVVGENGGGKSTLLKLIAKIHTPDKGNIDISAGMRTYYVAQEFSHEDFTKTVEKFIRDNSHVSVFNKVITHATILGLPILRLLKEECGILSGGQQKILSLSVALANSPDFLLLDEPENHLDIVSRKKLIELLCNYKNSIVFISHDKNIIDVLAEAVVEIADGKLYVSEGGYDEYIMNRQNRIGGIQRRFDSEEKRVKQLAKALIVLGKKAFRGKDVAMYNNRKAELEKIKKDHKETPRAKDEFTKIRLRETGSRLHVGKVLVKVENLTFTFTPNAQHLFSRLTFELRVGSHMILLGRNGSGKSTFLKLLEEKLQPLEGSIQWAHGVRVNYFDQHMNFDHSKTPLTVTEDHFSCPTEKARQILGAMKFIPEKMERRIGNLSGGEKMRLKFAITFGMDPDVVVLDEPTNHLDITTWETLLENCNKTSATIILVTHDEEFIDLIENKKFFVISKSHIQEKHKNLDELIEEMETGNIG